MSRSTITVRSAKTDHERLKAALASTADDLYPDGNGNVYITGVVNGERIMLGSVRENIAYSASLYEFNSLVDKVKFGSHTNASYPTKVCKKYDETYSQR